jgi:predicted HicB family RNase H-like nuclease
MAKPKEKKLIIVVPADLHRRLKVLSAETDQSMKTIVINALTTVLEPPPAAQKKSKTKKKKS